MRTKTSLTIVERAIIAVPDFEEKWLVIDEAIPFSFCKMERSGSFFELKFLNFPPVKTSNPSQST